MSDPCLEEYRDRIRRDNDPALFREIEQLLAQRREQVGGHLDRALCEQAGLMKGIETSPLCPAIPLLE